MADTANSQDPAAITAKSVSKNFLLPHQRQQSIKQSFTGLFQKGHERTIETQHALRDVSFEVKQGEFFGILGRNGSGKSTLLKILAGIYQPTTGSVTSTGKLVPFIELGVGFNPELTGRENVYLNGAMLGFSKAQMDKKYHSIVEFAELEDFMDQKLKNYSSGMQVRLAFSVATRAKADILLIDEVLAVGDADFQKKCFSYFRQLKKAKKTVVFVSHDMNAVRQYCDRAVLIEKGEVEVMGMAEDVAKHYTQLFTPNVEGGGGKEEGERNKKWGIGGAEITNLTVSDKVLRESSNKVDVTYEITSLQDQSHPLVAGITIKNEAGQPVCGTNSQILRVDTPVMRRNQTVEVRWEVPNIFNEGKYIIEPAVAQASDGEICQWWDMALSFEVVNEKSTPYITAPKILLSVNSTK